MTHCKHALVAFASAAMLLPAVALHAADLDDGLGGPPPAIAQTKVEFGTGWYVRGDIAATTNTFNVDAVRTSLDSVALGIRKVHNVGYDLSLGGGYSFLNGVRADIVGDFHQPGSIQQYNQPCVSTPVAGCQVEGKFTGYDVLANVYYDFGTWYRVTPYVGGGAGIAFGEPYINLYGDPSGNYYGKTGYHRFAFALMAGIAIDVYDHVKLDIGYRYLNNSSVGGTRMDNHEARIGVRYMIDALR